MSKHQGLHVQPDYQFLPMEEQTANDVPPDTRTDYDIFTSAHKSSRDAKTDQSSAAASLLSAAPPVSASAQSDPAYPHPIGSRYTGTWPKTQRLEPEWVRRAISLLAELCIATMALLFAVYGILVYRNQGRSAESSDSTGRKLYRISQYVRIKWPVFTACLYSLSLQPVFTARSFFCFLFPNLRTPGKLTFPSPRRLRQSSQCCLQPWWAAASKAL